ncbi:MAG: type II toxin-antitoxin system Phd/YefM family antitoxin [Candidatus Omnitrophica bacterium]|nr:type II toxin-antitoxin system Phd/YefM family antitoxin [Candidatus Omnitrophota bacterium]
MPIVTSYSKARERFAQLMDEAIDNRETVIIRRRGKEDAALIAASELASLEETTHLLRSPKNADRLLTALARARSRSLTPESLESLRRALQEESDK